MTRKLFFILLTLLFVSGISYAGPRYDRINKHDCYLVPDETHPFVNTNPIRVTEPIILEGEKHNGDYLIGPEIAVSGLSGFYDYQTNGDCKHMVYRVDATNMYAIYMTSLDSLNISPARRTKYACSGDEGSTWTDIGTVPNIRSGFCSLTAKADGSAAIGNHYEFVTGTLSGVLSIDAGPCQGTFTGHNVPPNFIWPGVARLTNNNILVVGETYRGGAATDSGAIVVYNTTSNTYGPLMRPVSPATSHTNMRWTWAAGPGGRAIYVFNTISDAGGSFGLNRMFKTLSTDNGTTWTTPDLLFDPQIVSGDTLAPFFGQDAIYDAAGNYYVAFNTTSPQGTFASAKLWVQKNGTSLYLVASHTGTNAIPEAANTVLHADAGIITLDHPSLSISADGSTIFVGYSVQYQNDTLNGYNKCHIYYSYAPLGTMSFAPPIRVTNAGAGSFDERYCSLGQTAPTISGQGVTLFMVYQKDRQPGSAAFNDNAPVSRASLMFRKITFANQPIGIHNLGNEVPKVYALHQNYPNPFNPTTKIRFELPVSGKVTLKIYNSLGEQISVLINENLSAGVMEYEYDASNLPSGVYFYTINAGNFTDTKKMVLLK